MSNLAVDEITDLAGTGSPTFPNGLGVGGGKILQVISTTKTDAFSVSSNTNQYVDITGFDVTITPSKTTSNILILGHVNGALSEGVRGVYRLMRDSTPIAVSSSGATIAYDQDAFESAEFRRGFHHASFNYLDSPSSTSPITYKLQVLDEDFLSPTIYVNRNADTSFTTVSTITIMEVAE